MRENNQAILKTQFFWGVLILFFYCLALLSPDQDSYFEYGTGSTTQQNADPDAHCSPGHNPGRKQKVSTWKGNKWYKTPNLFVRLANSEHIKLLKTAQYITHIKPSLFFIIYDFMP
jgi:hypothetical protein